MLDSTTPPTDWEALPLLISGHSANGTTVTVELQIDQQQTNYHGRLRYQGAPLQLIVEQIVTERTSAGLTQTTVQDTVSQLNLNDLIAQVGGVEKLSTLQLLPIAPDAEEWMFATPTGSYPNITLDLLQRRVVYAIDR
jgi:hypothetical protein